MKTLGNAIGSSAYVEKERNWAVEGGIAQGIGGVAAGVSAAVDAMQENERIRARNEANKQWAADTKDKFLQQAREAEQNRPKSHTLEKLASQYKADLCDSPLTLYGQLQEMTASVSVDDNNAGILMVRVRSPMGSTGKRICALTVHCAVRYMMQPTSLWGVLIFPSPNTALIQWAPACLDM